MPQEGHPPEDIPEQLPERPEEAEIEKHVTNRRPDISSKVERGVSELMKSYLPSGEVDASLHPVTAIDLPPSDLLPLPSNNPQQQVIGEWGVRFIPAEEIFALMLGLAEACKGETAHESVLDARIRRSDWARLGHYGAEHLIPDIFEAVVSDKGRRVCNEGLTLDVWVRHLIGLHWEREKYQKGRGDKWLSRVFLILRSASMKVAQAISQAREADQDLEITLAPAFEIYDAIAEEVLPHID